MNMTYKMLSILLSSIATIAKAQTTPSPTPSSPTTGSKWLLISLCAVGGVIIFGAFVAMIINCRGSGERVRGGFEASLAVASKSNLASRSHYNDELGGLGDKVASVRDASVTFKHKGDYVDDEFSCAYTEDDAGVEQPPSEEYDDDDILGEMVEEEWVGRLERLAEEIAHHT